MKKLSAENINISVINLISDVAEKENVEIYLVGGFVRDLILERKSKDIDVLVIGNGIDFAKIVAKKTNDKIQVFKNFGTAMLKTKDYEIEFVGARKESYNSDSRKPTIEEGNLEEDLSRRDFTINTLAISLNKKNYGEIVNLFDGINDIKRKIIKTPKDPQVTFHDDPLRMFRAARFASQLNFKIDKENIDFIKKEKNRIDIISKERINIELEFKENVKIGLSEKYLGEIKNNKWIFRKLPTRYTRDYVDDPPDPEPPEIDLSESN